MSRAKSNGSPNFDGVARIYRWAEALTFGPWLWRCRTAFLPALSTARSALVLGDGDGRFTAELLRSNRDIRVDAVDISPAMLRALQRHARENAGRVRTLVADVRNWTSAHTSEPEIPAIDLVVTHFFLDCLTTEEVVKLALQLRRRVAPNSRWIISEFAIPGDVFGRLVAKPLIGLLYVAFRILTGLQVGRLPDYGSALGQAGFVLEQRREFLRGLLVAEAWTLKTEEREQC